MSEVVKMIAVTATFFGLLHAKIHFGGTYCLVKRDLTGKVAIITGGNTGIGKEAAVGLAQEGCEVIIAARDVQKSLKAVADIKERSKNSKIHFLPLDLGSKQSIDDFTEEVKQQYGEINILINNAGVMRIPERKQTLDGFQMQFGINHLGHFYLTSKLWTLLKKSKDLRIINVSSEAHRRIIFDKNAVDLDWKNLNFDYDYSPGMAYSRSKLANVLFTQQLARKLKKTHPDARCVCLHPGVVRTEIGRYTFEGPKMILMYALTPIFHIFMKSPWQGAQTILYTVFEDKQKLPNGQYYSQCKVDKNKNPFANDPSNQKILWKFSQKMLGIQFNPS